MSKVAVSLVVISLVYLGMAIWKLDLVPREWYGDVDVTAEYINEILAFNWPVYFTHGAGPVPYYLAAPLVWILSKLFYGYVLYKLVTVLIGYLGVLGIYWLGKEWGGERIGAGSGLIAGVSFWYLVIMRQGNVHLAFVPVLSIFTLVFLVRFGKYKKLRDILRGCCAVLETLNMIFWNYV